MQARGFLNYRLKYCWPKVIYCICQPNELKREIKKKLEGAKQGANQKSRGAMAYPGSPLEPPLRVWYVEYYSAHAHIAWSQKFRKSEISLDSNPNPNKLVTVRIRIQSNSSPVQWSSLAGTSLGTKWTPLMFRYKKLNTSWTWHHVAIHQNNRGAFAKITFVF